MAGTKTENGVPTEKSKASENILKFLMKGLRNERSMGWVIRLQLIQQYTETEESEGGKRRANPSKKMLNVGSSCDIHKRWPFFQTSRMPMAGQPK